jgi:hypothetical protein
MTNDKSKKLNKKLMPHNFSLTVITEGQATGLTSETSAALSIPVVNCRKICLSRLNFRIKY